MDGLVYLETEGLEHTKLSSETVLLNFKGEVKIGKLIFTWQVHQLKLSL